jgi:predicted Fe-Mo cluster-binding NifX family protein
MARLAVTTWNGRVSPVFDVAEHFLLIDGPVDGPRERQVCGLTEPGEQARLQWLMVHDVDVVICGAVSRQLAQRLRAAGVSLFSGVCGEVEAVVSAYHRGTLRDNPALRLPGVPSDVDKLALGGRPSRRGRPL